MGTSTLFPPEPASPVAPGDTTWLSTIELVCGECSYGVTARREIPHCPMCGAEGVWKAPAARFYRSAPSIRLARYGARNGAAILSGGDQKGWVVATDESSAPFRMWLER